MAIPEAYTGGCGTTKCDVPHFGGFTASDSKGRMSHFWGRERNSAGSRRVPVVSRPFAPLGVYEQDRQPMRGRFPNRFRVLYKQRNQIKFLGGEYDQQPERFPSPRISPRERRKLVASGIKAGKSQRLIARDLNSNRDHNPPRLARLEGPGHHGKQEANRHSKEAHCSLERQRSCGLG